MHEATLYKTFPEQKIQCLACAHHCLIPENGFGKCMVRQNKQGKLYLLVYSKVFSIAVDPIEKKPLYHFMPKTKTLSFGTVGCNFRCDFCQNWEMSQASKGPDPQIIGQDISPEQIVQKALDLDCPSISYTYNEPAIFLEFVKDTATIAKSKGIKNILVTNGYFSEESFNYIKPYIDAMNIDLKSITEDFYRKRCGGHIQPVLDTIKRAHKAKIHIELTTLVIPGENDSLPELEQIAKFIASISPDIPWHISRFFPHFKMQRKPLTPLATLKQAEFIGKKYLHYVHLGNV